VSSRRKGLPSDHHVGDERRFLAHVDRIAKLDVGWNDWGTPEAIERSVPAMGVLPPWQAPLRAAG